MVHPTPEMSPPSIKQSPLPCATFEGDAIWKSCYISEVRDDLTHSAGRALTFVVALNKGLPVETPHARNGAMAERVHVAATFEKGRRSTGLLK